MWTHSYNRGKESVGLKVEGVMDRTERKTECGQTRIIEVRKVWGLRWTA